MDKINIQAAAGCDLERVMDFYHSLIDAMKDAEYKPGWKKGIFHSGLYSGRRAVYRRK